MANRPMTQAELMRDLELPALDRLPPLANEPRELLISAPGRGGDEAPTLDLEPVRLDDHVVGWRITTPGIEPGIQVRAVDMPSPRRDRKGEVPARVPEGQPVLPRPIGGAAAGA